MSRTARVKRLVQSVVVVAVTACVVVSAAGALRFDDASYLTPTGVVGAPYTHRFTAPPPGTSGAGCDPPYIVQVDSGALPPGLTLRSDGLVGGTPTQAGEWSFWVSIRDDPTDKPWCNPLSAEREFTIRVTDRLVIGPDSAGPATVGAPFTLAMTATLSEPKAWSIVDGVLPPGLSLGRASGVISGTPITSGSFPFTVRAVVDSLRSDTKALTIVVREPLTAAAGRPFDTGAHRALAEVGVAFRSALVARGGSGTYTWSLVAGSFPAGVALDRAGQVAGTPTEPGSSRFTASVADGEGRTATYDATLAVAPRLVVVSARLHPAEVGHPYRARLRADGGVAPIRWRIRGGALPPGLRLDPAKGTIGGIARVVGRRRVVVEAVDRLGVTARRTLVLVVRA